MIKNVVYLKNGSISAEIDGEELHVSDDPSNRHRIAIAEWEKQGNTIAPYIAPPAPIPQVVSRFQARAALYNAGMLEAVDAAIANADPITQMAWADAREFRRDSPTILAMADVMELSEEQVDDLFIAASLIEA